MLCSVKLGGVNNSARGWQAMLPGDCTLYDVHCTGLLERVVLTLAAQMLRIPKHKPPQKFAKKQEYDTFDCGSGRVKTCDTAGCSVPVSLNGYAPVCICVCA